MGSIGNRNKTDKEEIKWSEELIQQQLRYSFLSPSSVKYFTENLNVYDWESDVLKITRSGYAYEFEIKISRGDFKNDFKHKKKKHLLLENKENKSKMPNYFYYVVPEDLITEDEVPEYAGLIYVHATIIGNSRVYYQFQEIKAAPKLHSDKIDENNLNLIDKFYYNYIHWKHKHEKDIIEYKEQLEKYRTSEGKTYKYTLPQAMEEISRLEKESKMWCEDAENWRKLAQEEIRIQRRLTRKLVELGVTDKELDEITGHEIIDND
jgi:hypothetical protein